MGEKIRKKEIFKLIGINILLFILLFGLVTINKQFFRPTFNHSHFALILTGSFPNFIAAYLISLCVVNPVLIKKPKFGRQIIYVLSFIIMAILIFEEFKSIAESLGFINVASAPMVRSSYHADLQAGHLAKSS